MSKNTTNGASVVKQLKEVPGLFVCFLEHQVSKTQAQFKWEGPTIPEEEWQQMLAFFQWSYDTTKSETQVRLYVNKVTRTWRIWAYPQEAKTGMSAFEIDNDKAKEQRAQFNPTEGWLYFGTVHHHCGCNAFQSSVDENNEKGQDGLHITVGNMDAKRYSIHDRFYLCGSRIDHDLSWFWDIGDVMATIPEWAVRLLPDNTRDRVARGQMCEKAPDGTTFPEVWKENLVYVAPKVVVSSYVGGLGYSPSTGKYKFQRQPTNTTFDFAEAREQLLAWCVKNNVEELDAIAEMQHILKNDLFLTELISLMYRNDVGMDKFCEYCAGQYMEEVERASSGKKDNSQPDKKVTGVPDYEGGRTDFGGMSEM